MAIEDVPAASELAAFRAELRAWLADNMPRPTDTADSYDQSRDRLRELMSTLWRGGYAGLCFPEEVGGRGLTRSHHRVFCEEAGGYEMPIFVGNPGLSIIAPPILEFGTPEQEGPHTTHAQGRGDLRADDVGAVEGPTWPAPAPGPSATVRRGCSTVRRSGAPGPFAATGPHPGQDQLGRPEAPRAQHVPPRPQPAGHHHQPHPGGQRFRGVLPGVLRRRARRCRLPARRAGRRVDGRQPAAVPRACRRRRRLTARLPLLRAAPGRGRRAEAGDASSLGASGSGAARGGPCQPGGRRPAHPSGHRGHPVRPGPGDRWFAAPAQHGPHPHARPLHQPRAGRGGRGCLAGRRGRPRCRRGLRVTPGAVHRRRHQRDAAQPHQRAPPRHASRAAASRDRPFREIHAGGR